ncbi:MAG: T9SS type A sorting domain-containing protein [Candidatus Symbiothrix sp.]|nr:T9SS type A sorting domain-containing protein [Candidatus Symbiothrix sp.]
MNNLAGLISERLHLNGIYIFKITDSNRIYSKKILVN